MDQPVPAKTANDTVKAVVLDGVLYPSDPQFDYDSITYSPGASRSVIKDYTKTGLLMWQEVLDYDAQGRVTAYTADYNPNYRHCHFSYTANDSFPSAFIDSFYDSDLFIHALNRTGVSITAAGTTYTYRHNYSIPTQGSYPETYDVNYVFNTAGRLTSAGSSAYSSQNDEVHFYTADGLLDSTRTTQYNGTTLISSSGAKNIYTNYANPLSPLGRMVYRNLYPFLSHTIGLYTFQLSLSNLYTGFYAARLPQSATEFDNSNTPDISYTYSYQFQGTALKAINVRVFDSSFTPSTTTVAVRIY